MDLSYLDFDGFRIKDVSVSGWVIKDSNGIVKMNGNKHLSNALIIIAEYITMRDDVLAGRDNGFLNMEI